MHAENMQQLLALQKDYFHEGHTRPVAFRRAALEKLRQGILAYEPQILAALAADLNKTPFEGYMTEIGMVLDELRYVIKHVAKWAKAERVATPLTQFSARSFVLAEPYGVALILSPWNYPFQLCMEPLIGALAAGNCAVIKPSAYAPATSRVVAELVKELFPRQYVAVVEGGRQENAALLELPFDYIFFTGSVAVGKLVMERAAQHLTPVTLELGGKSPCIVDENANLALAARRLAFGKVLNAGQTCVAPDYLLVHHAVKEQFLTLLKKEIAACFPDGDLSQMPTIINDKHYQRVMGLMQGETVVLGGRGDAARRMIEPTILDGVSWQSPIMQEEIFGPVLPVLSYDNLPNLVRQLQKLPKPLALYLFTKNKQVEQAVLGQLSFGGGCINDTIIHLATPRMSFGGVGQSGMGSYHGKASFDTFSHKKSIVKKHNWIDLPMRYHPYDQKKERMLRRFLK